MVSAYIEGSEVKKAQDAVEAYYAQIKTTEVWKALGLDAQIASIQKQLLAPSTPGAAAVSANMIQVLQGVLAAGFKSINTTIEANGTTVTAHYTAKLNTAEQKTNLITALRQSLAHSNGVLNPPTETTPGGDFTATFGKAPSSATLQMITSDSTTLSSVFTVTGVDTAEALAAQTSSGDVAKQTNLLEKAALPNSAAYWVSNQTAAGKLLSETLAKLSESAFPDLTGYLPTVQTKLDAVDATGVVATTISLSPSLRSKSCSIGAVNQMEIPAVSRTEYKPIALSYINSRTPVFFSTTTDTVLGYLKTALVAAAKDPQDTKSSTPKVEANAAQASLDLDQVTAGVYNLNLREISVVASVPTVGFNPVYGVIFTADKPLTTTAFSTQLGNALKTLKGRYPEANLPIITSSSEGSVKLDLGDGTSVEGKNVSPNALLFTATPSFFDEIEGIVKKAKPFISEERLNSAGLGELARAPNLLVYLSTSSLMPLAKQFAPFLSMINPAAKLTDKDYTQILSLLEFSGLYAESVSPVVDGMACTISGIGLLNAMPSTAAVE